MRILFNPNYAYKKENYGPNFAGKASVDTEKLKALVQSGGGGASLPLKSASH